MPLVVQVQSFGFRYGIPPDSDLVIDVRFLPNPHFLPELQGLTGLDPAVSEYVVITSYSIHYTKLYETTRGNRPAPPRTVRTT